MDIKQLIILGPPGAGAREQAIAVAQRLRVVHVSMEQLMAAAIAKSTNEEPLPHPWPDDLIFKFLRRRLEQPDTMMQGWVLEGFPRTVGQAQLLNDFLEKVGQPPAQVAYIKTTTGILINRLSSSTDYTPIPVLRSQLAQYQTEIEPVLDYYRQQQQLTTVNGCLSSGEITQGLDGLFTEETDNVGFIQDESELDSLLAQEPLLVVDCMASWCGSCKLVTPLIDQLANAYGNQVNVRKIDFDANQQIHQRFGLKGMPAVMFFKEGQLVETLTGVKPYGAYTAALTRCLD